MSNLSEQIKRMLQQQYLCLNNEEARLLNIFLDKAKQYEGIGEPSELRKVTFCHKCRFSLPKSLGEGLISGLSGLACQ